MARKAQLAAALAVVALAAAGCGSDNGTTPPSTTTLDLTGQTVEVAATFTGIEQENFQAVLDEFARQTKATVKYTSGGNDLAVLLNSRIAGGAPPDVALIPQPGVVAEFAKRGVLKELTGDAAAAVNANYSEAWKGLGTIDGKLYGVVLQGREQVRHLVPDRRLLGSRRPATQDLGRVQDRVPDALRLGHDSHRGRGWRRMGPHRLVRERVSAGRWAGELRQARQARDSRGPTPPWCRRCRSWPITGAHPSTSRVVQRGRFR